MSFVSVHCTISKNLRFFVSDFRPSQSLLAFARIVKYSKTKKIFKPINTLSTNRLHSISVSSGIKKTTSYWYHQKKDYFCIIKRTFFCILLRSKLHKNQAFTKPIFTQKRPEKHRFPPIFPHFAQKRPFPPIFHTRFLLPQPPFLPPAKRHPPPQQSAPHTLPNGQ